jgi:hypothetical protein
MTHAGTHDVQTVTVSQDDEGIRVQCSFVENSLARGCQIVLCLEQIEGEVGTCSNLTLLRSSPESTIPVSEMGNYVVTSVADIEGNGRIEVIGNLLVFGSLEVSVTSTAATTIGTFGKLQVGLEAE